MPRLTLIALSSLLATALATTDYVWTLKWTGPNVCTSYPCPYSYDVSGPSFIAGSTHIPAFEASCEGTVDEPLADCDVTSTIEDEAAMGNFSSWSTSGVNADTITFSAEWTDSATGQDQIIQGTTEFLATEANNETWELDLGPCPITTSGCNSTVSSGRAMRMRRHVPRIY